MSYIPQARCVFKHSRTIALHSVALTIAALSGQHFADAATGGPESSASATDGASTVSASPATVPALVQQTYAAGKTLAAMRLLSPWLKAHPTDAYAHYLQANCLLKQNLYPEASYEYARAEQLAPQSKIAEYCRTAQAQLTALQSASTHAETRRHITIEDAESEDDESNAPANSQHSETVPTPLLKKGEAVPPGTLELIRKQSEMAQRSAAASGAAEAANERLKAATEVKSLQEKAERLAGHPRGSSEPAALSAEDKERLRSQSAASSERLKEIGELKAAEAEEGYRYKADEIRRQATHLQEMLLDPTKGGTKLNPVGTNLYIRNYAKPPERALQTNVKMRSLAREVDASSRSQQTGIKMRSSNRASSANSSPSAVSGVGQAETHVRGEVLDK